MAALTTMHQEKMWARPQPAQRAHKTDSSLSALGPWQGLPSPVPAAATSLGLAEQGDDLGEAFSYSFDVPSALSLGILVMPG